MTTHYHFVGIGGIGMGTIASLLLDKGFKVSGSDAKSGKMTDMLAVKGAKIFIGHAAHQVRGADCVVLSSAIPQDNPEWQAAIAKGIRVMHRAEVLAGLMRDTVSIGVAGAHGKTTTTSMIAQLFVDAGLNPTTAIGGIVKTWPQSALVGDSEYFIAELDESDGSFLHFNPHYSVITNIDAEHMDFYKTMDRVEEYYLKFLDRTGHEGIVIAFGEDPILRRLLERSRSPYRTYGLEADNDLYAGDVRLHPFGSRFNCVYQGNNLGEVELSVPGEHNIKNACAGLLLGLHCGIGFETLKKSLAQFHGVRRRFDLVGSVNDILIVDDYGHHPTEIRAALKTARGLNRRVIAVFQPHRYSRTYHLWNEFVQCFSDCGHLIVTDIYAAGEKPLEGVSAQRLAGEIGFACNHPVIYQPKDKILECISEIIRPGDCVMTLGAGDITDVAHRIREHLETKFISRSLVTG